MNSERDKLEQALKELAARERAFEEAQRALPEAAHAYKLAFAVAFQAAEGSSADAKKQAALIATERLYLAHLVAETEAEITKQKILDCRLALSCRQSLASYEKSEMEFARTSRSLT